MKTIIQQLDKAFDNRLRLGIMSALMVNEEIDFVSLRELLGISDGNLASHMKALEKAGYVKVKKRFVSRKPKTSYAASAKGRRAFDQHLKALEKLIGN